MDRTTGLSSMVDLVLATIPSDLALGPVKEIMYYSNAVAAAEY